MITLKDFVEIYGGGACYISIDGYCEEASFDYYSIPDNPEDALSNDNPNHHQPTCLQLASWFDEIKDRQVKRFNILGGGMYPLELSVELEDEEDE